MNELNMVKLNDLLCQKYGTIPTATLSWNLEVRLDKLNIGR
jgi:hypothetical protein